MRIVRNTVSLVVIAAVAVFLAPVSVEKVIDQAVNNPLISGAVVLMLGFFVLFGSSKGTANGGGGV